MDSNRLRANAIFRCWSGFRRFIISDEYLSVRVDIEPPVEVGVIIGAVMEDMLESLDGVRSRSRFCDTNELTRSISLGTGLGKGCWPSGKGGRTNPGANSTSSKG